MKPQRIQRKRVKGYRMPENTVSVTRPGKWGNPFEISEHGREGAIKMFRYALIEATALPRLLHEKFEYMRQHIHELKGKNLACFCKEGEACHADLLLELANPEEGKKPELSYREFKDKYPGFAIKDFQPTAIDVNMSTEYILDENGEFRHSWVGSNRQ